MNIKSNYNSFCINKKIKKQNINYEISKDVSEYLSR